MRVGVVPEGSNERMALERDVHDAPLHSAAASVDDPKLPQAGFVRGAHVLIDHGGDVGWKEGMEVQLGSNWMLVDHVSRLRGTKR